MSDNLLISLLRTFSNKEINAFFRFVESKYFNTDEETIRLLHSLVKHLHTDKPFSDQVQIKIYTSVFKKKVEGEQLNAKQKSQFNFKVNALYTLAKRFLVLEKIDEHPDAYSKILYQELQARNLNKHLKRQLKKDKKQIEQLKIKDSDYYAHAYQVENGLLNYLYHTRLIIKEDNLEEVIFQLDMHYIIKKLKNQLTTLSKQRISDKKKYDFSVYEALIPLINLPQYNDQPLITMYCEAINLIQSSEKKDYDKFLERLIQNQSFLSLKDKDDFFTTASNFCVRGIIKGKMEYLYKAYELFKIMDELDTLTENGLLHIGRLKNIVNSSCRVQDFKWANYIIQKYEPVFQHKDKKSVKHLNLGAIAYYQNDFETAIRHFIKVNKVNLTYDVDCKVMLIKSHYEMDIEYDERTMTIFRSAEQFFAKHQQLKSIRKQAYKNFIRLLINIYKVRFRVGKGTIASVHKKMEQMNYISDKKWLLEKLELLS